MILFYVFLIYYKYTTSHADRTTIRKPNWYLNIICVIKRVKLNSALSSLSREIPALFYTSLNA